MSKANGASGKKDTFLQHVSLRNYKSIKNLEIDFKPGLNIIIGKNSSGKTNFINALDTVLNYRYHELEDSEIELKAIFNGEPVEIKATNANQSLKDWLDIEVLDNSPFHEMSLEINGNAVDVHDYEDVEVSLFEKSYFFKETLIKYGNPYKDFPRFVNLPFAFVLVNNDKISRELRALANDRENTKFINVFFKRLHLDILGLYSNLNKIDISKDQLKKQIMLFSNKHLDFINKKLNSFSPIKYIRLNPDFNIITESEGTREIATHFYLEFLVDNNWLNFELLSDGTKRLFYVVSELLSNNPPAHIKDNDIDIVLLEEPELGIHPHQLHSLMQFIKDQSREKQIILTTHSPQVLDILEPDELDRVIICHNDSKEGTKLSHLTDKEIGKAKKYMQEEAFLSDYWRFSDLEPAS